MQILETYTVKSDAKGRLALPSGLRKALGVQMMAEGFFLRRSMHERCLEMYPWSSWEKELEKVQGLNPYVREHRSFMRRFMAGVRFVEADTAGRINVPSDLAKWAGFGSDIVLSPVGGFFEVWDGQAYENALSLDEGMYGEMAERIMGGCLPARDEE